MKPNRTAAPEEKLRKMPGHLIRRVHQISTAIFAEECAAFDLTAVQYAALAAIRSHPGVDATSLSGLIALDRSTIGDVLERLESKGWVRRTPSPGDKRVKILNLSPEGGRLLARVNPSVARVQERLLEPLEPEDRIHFIRLLTHLANLQGRTSI